jgi:hypothetical protein
MSNYPPGVDPIIAALRSEGVLTDVSVVTSILRVMDAVRHEMIEDTITLRTASRLYGLHYQTFTRERDRGNLPDPLMHVQGVDLYSKYALDRWRAGYQPRSGPRPKHHDVSITCSIAGCFNMRRKQSPDGARLDVCDTHYRAHLSTRRGSYGK